MAYWGFADAADFGGTLTSTRTGSETERGWVHLSCIVEDFRITGLSVHECPTSEWIGFYMVFNCEN